MTKRGRALFLDLKVCHSEQSQHWESFYDSLVCFLRNINENR
jgi:hypothetical protein